MSNTPRRYYIRLRVLHVEDNPLMARTVRRLLTHASNYADFDILCVANLRDAVEQLNDSTQRWDCILLDLTLPDCVGAATFEAIYKNTEIPIVVLTAEDDIDLRTAIIGAGAQDCIFKGDIGTEILARSIRFAVERCRSLRELRRAVRELEEAKQTMELILGDLDFTFKPTSH